VTVPPAGNAAISIVLPSLNHGAFIETAIRSVLDQQVPGVELVVVDGGSTDGTAAVLQRYRRQLSHCLTGPDAGPAAALNAGFTLADGNVLGVLNADDFLLPGSLETIRRAFDTRPEVDVVSGHGYFARPDGTLGVMAYSDPWHPTRFRYGACVLLQPATFFRRQAFLRAGGFRDSRRVCWDMELWGDLSRTGAVFATIDERLAAFRLHPDSITGRPELRARRRADAREVAAELAGTSDSPVDRALHYWHRARKFARHPVRVLRQRWFLHSVLKRWSI
jgi:glycosyltransferase involved in cell wall biosynthesis